MGALIRIVLADDHEVVRCGQQALLTAEPDFRVVAQASDGLEAVKLTEELKPEVLVVDIAMPGLNGIDVIAQVHKTCPHTAVVVFSMYTAQSYVAQAFRNGASAYVAKNGDAEDLTRAIRAVMRGERYLGQPLSLRAVELYLDTLSESSDDPWDTLTAREREVLAFAAEGLSNAAIGERLFISARTVETHRASLMRKLGLRGQTELVLYAVRRGLLTPDQRV
jgi:two-component system, NarL family, response regulator NreC